MTKFQQRLAWHETLDMHELVALQTNGLIKLKRAVHDVKDPHLIACIIRR